MADFGDENNRFEGPLLPHHPQTGIDVINYAQIDERGFDRRSASPRGDRDRTRSRSPVDRDRA